MLVFAGFLFVGLKTKAGAGLIKAWNMATNTEYTMEGHTVSAGCRAMSRGGGAGWVHGGVGSEHLQGALILQHRLPAAPPPSTQTPPPPPPQPPPLQGAVQALAAAGDMLFSAGQDQTLRVWKLDGATNQWQCVAVLRQEQGGHRAPIAALWASHPFLFSADYLGTLKVGYWVGVECVFAQ